MERERIHVSIALPSNQVAIIVALKEGRIDFAKDTLREIAAQVGIKINQPQQVKHHLEQLVKLGVLDIVRGQYSYPVIIPTTDTSTKNGI